jgi:hypothetical protein
MAGIAADDALILSQHANRPGWNLTPPLVTKKVVTLFGKH